MIIVLFHVFYLLGKFVFRRYSGECERELESQDLDDEPYPDVERYSGTMREPLKRRHSNDDLEEESKSTIKFSPPAYIQRYQAVLEVLTDPQYRSKMKKIVDFGCSELGFCMYLKNMTGVEEALFVDIDRHTLDVYKDKAKPLLVDHLHRRSTPLVMRVLEGSITEPDKQVENCDAVVCIELIEHLYPETLTDLPYNIFGYIKPRVAIITTPNADFNVLFGKMTGFRHWDHKFEWTRKQFEDWANNVVLRFPDYEVTFKGICFGPPGTEELGACSQMAVFKKVFDFKDEKIPGIEGLYKTVVEHEYPYEVDNRSDEQKILDDAVYFIRKFSMNEEDLEEEVPLQRLLNVMSNYYITLDELKEILQNANWTVEDREGGLVVLVPAPSSSTSNHSLDEDAFLDHDNPWDEEAGPPIGYYNRDNYRDIDVVEEAEWDLEPRFPAEIIENEHVDHDTENIQAVEEENWDSTCSLPGSSIDIANLEEEFEIESEIIENGEVQNAEDNLDLEIAEAEMVAVEISEAANSSTLSVFPDDVCLDDIETENRSTELNNSAVEDSLNISSFSETRGSDNSETRNTFSQTQEAFMSTDSKTAETYNSSSSPQTVKEKDEESFVDASSDASEYRTTTSICSMFLEPSKTSEAIHLDKSDTFLDTTITSPLVSRTSKKLKLENCTSSNYGNENSFEEPQCASSPHIQSSLALKKRKVLKQDIEHSSSYSPTISNEDLLCTNDRLENSVEESNGKSEDKIMCSNESVIASSNVSSENSPESNNYGSPNRIRQGTGAIPKVLSTSKLSDTKLNNVQKETKLGRISPDTPESLPNSWSPEIMDSGYPNSNSPPDLSPEYDLSSIAQDRTSDSESPSIADAPRIDFFNPAEFQNRDLVNNNLDDEGNNMEAEHEHINDIRPLINVLENDLENENDIYVARNGFPMWLLRILQRFDAEGIGINLPMPQPPNENFGG